MRIAVVGLLLAVGAVLVLWLGETFNSGGSGSLVAIQVILLMCIPISLALFVFLSHQHQEGVKAQRQPDEQHQSDGK